VSRKARWWCQASEPKAKEPSLLMIIDNAAAAAGGGYYYYNSLCWIPLFLLIWILDDPLL